MRLLDFFTHGKKRPVEVQDPVFGRLTYDQDMWSHIPRPSEDGFMVVVDAPDTGPAKVQQDLFLNVRSNLPGLIQKAREYIRSQPTGADETARLTLYAVEIGTGMESEKGHFVLELTDEDAAVIHRVSFEHDQPAGYELDD